VSFAHKKVARCIYYLILDNCHFFYSSFRLFNSVLHVFTMKAINLQALGQEIEAKFKSESTTHLAIFYDVCFHHSLSNFTTNSKSINLQICKPELNNQDENTKCGRICNVEIDSKYACRLMKRFLIKLIKISFQLVNFICRR